MAGRLEQHTYDDDEICVLFQSKQLSFEGRLLAVPMISNDVRSWHRGIYVLRAVPMLNSPFVVLFIWILGWGSLGPPAQSSLEIVETYVSFHSEVLRMSFRSLREFASTPVGAALLNWHARGVQVSDYVSGKLAVQQLIQWALLLNWYVVIMCKGSLSNFSMASLLVGNF